MSINPNDIQLTYNGIPIRLAPDDRTHATALADRALARGRNANHPCVAKQQTEESGCMDFNPGVDDADHPVLHMSNFEQIVDAEVGGGKPFASFRAVSKPVRVHRIERNYALNPDTVIHAGDYLLEATVVESGKKMWVYFPRAVFEAEYVRTEQRKDEIQEYAVPNPHVAALDEKCGKLENDNRFLRDCLKQVRQNNDRFTEWFLGLAVDCVNHSEDLAIGSEFLDKNVL